MIDLSNILQKINKPFHYLVVGAVIIIVAPDNIKWSGFVLLALGLAGAIEWLFSKTIKGFKILRSKNKEKKYKNEIVEKLNSLSEQEKEVIGNLRRFDHIKINGFDLNDHDPRGQNIYRILQHLENKKIVESTTDNYGISPEFTFYLPYQIRAILDEMIEQEVRGRPFSSPGA